jgi:hypothetical protein
MGYAAAMANPDHGMKLIAAVSLAVCVAAMALVYFAGWRSDEAATVFVVCLLFTPILAARLRGP